MSMTNAVRTALNFAAAIAVAIPLAANAAEPVIPPPPPPHKPYQPAVQNDATEAYQYRTRIISSPNCLHYAAQSDAAFLDDKIDVQAKVELIKKIGAEAAANGCLGP